MAPSLPYSPESQALLALLHNPPATGAALVAAEIARLLAAGADIEARGHDGLTPLQHCLARPRLDRVPSPEFDVLHAMISTLLSQGADLDAAMPDARTAESMAAAHNKNLSDVIACERLRRTYPGLADAVPVVRSWWIKPLEIVTAREHGAYLRACNAGDREQLRYILHLYPQAVHWHADWNGTGGTNGLGACIYAGGHTHRAAAMLLSAGINVNWRDDQGRTALMLACASQHGGGIFIPLLMAAGASIHSRDHHGQTAMDYARANKAGGIARLLDDALARRAAHETTLEAARNQHRQHMKHKHHGRRLRL